MNKNLNRNNYTINRQISSIIGYVSKYYVKKVTPFLSPYEINNVLMSVNQYSATILYKQSGGYNSAERQRLIFYPQYTEIKPADFEIQLFEIKFNYKFNQLKHYQILGKLANLGLDRNIFGDIITDGKRWQFFAIKQFTDFIVDEITQIGRFTVKVIPQTSDKLIAVKNDFVNETVVSSSLRLDALTALAFHQSRKRAKELINSGHVFVNWEHERRVDYNVMVGDSISCRGWGRFTVIDFLGFTQTNKSKLYLRIFRH